MILGGGFGGLAAARVFGRYPKTLERAGLAPVLVDRVHHHVYTPLLYEVASGCTTERGAAAGMELSAGVSLHFSSLLAECCGVSALEQEVVSIDTQQRLIRLASGGILPYEYAILAFGSETDFYNIPGLQHHSYPLKRRSHALLIRQRVQEFIDKKRRGQEARIEIMVGGGGATGVEFSGELAHCFQKMTRAGALSDGDWSVTLVEASPRLLGMLAPEDSEYARRRLVALGVTVLRDTCIKRADRGGVVLAPRPTKAGESSDSLLCDFRGEAERRFEVDVLVWTGGVRAPEITHSLGVPVDSKGRVIVDEFLRVPGAENLYAIGDISALQDPATKQTVPQLAQSAIEAGELAARNIIATITGHQPKRFFFHSYPSSIPLGGKVAITVIGRFRFRGLMGWILRAFADFRYFLRVMPPTTALRIFWSGARVYTQND